MELQAVKLKTSWEPANAYLEFPFSHPEMTEPSGVAHGIACMGRRAGLQLGGQIRWLDNQSRTANFQIPQRDELMPGQVSLSETTGHRSGHHHPEICGRTPPEVVDDLLPDLPIRQPSRIPDWDTGTAPGQSDIAQLP
ncbi:hypothetical protein GCM10011345_38330 [Gemmobacter megaterium]|nr:hypothetical protein GCM10011345_38330 [Gemmobacter megaterium]